MINMDSSHSHSLRGMLRCGIHDEAALVASGIPYTEVIDYYNYEYGVLPSFGEVVVESIYIFSNEHGLLVEDIEIANPSEVDLIIDRLGSLPEVYVKDTLDVELRKSLEEYVGHCAYVYTLRTII